MVGGTVILPAGIFALPGIAARSSRGRFAQIVFFGPAWWLANAAPTLVTYDTFRHYYLAVAGPAVALGLAVEALWVTGGRTLRRAVAAGAGALVVGSFAILGPVVADRDAAGGGSWG